MPVPSDPYDFVNGTIADGDQVDERFRRLYAAFNPAVQGIDDSNLNVSNTTGIKSFLRLVSAQRIVMTGLLDLGSTGILSPGSQTTLTATHNLGTLNVLVLATARDSASNVPSAVQIAQVSDGATTNAAPVQVRNVSDVACNTGVKCIVIGFF
jgi:hypothetical protein